MKLVWVLSGMMAAGWQGAWAQEIPPTTLPPVEVTVTRDVARSPLELPFAITRVVPDSLRPGQRNLTADETLLLVPGVTVSNRNNPTQDPRIAVRGFGARAAFGVRSVRILRDGIPLTLPDGQTPTDYLDLASVGSVEVIRGSASALYGNAAGGVVDFRTEAPPAEPFAVDLRGLTSGYGLWRWSAGAGGTTRSVRYQGLLTRTAQDGYRRHAQQETTHGSARVLHTMGGTELAWQASVFDMPVAENPGALTAAEVAADPRQAVAAFVTKRARKDVDQQQLSLTATRAAGAAGEATLALYGGRRMLDNPLTFAVVAIDRATFGGSARLTAPVTFLGGRHRLSIGVDVQRLDDDRKNFENCNGVAARTAVCPRADTVERGALRLDQRETVTGIGPYVRDELSLGRVQLHGGVRADYVVFDVEDRFITAQNPDDSGRRTLSAWSPMGGVLLRVGVLTSVYANVATTFETPTATELANRPEGAGGINDDLDPQHATTFEAGVKGFLGTRVRYDVAAFTTDVRDELIPFEVPNGAGRRYFRNAGGTTRRGLEAGIEWAVGALALASAYSYSDFQFDDYAVVTGPDTTRFDGKRIPGIPEHQLQASATWRPGALFLTGESIVWSRVFVDDANSAAAAGWTVVNVRAGARIPIAGLVAAPTLGIYNLFDRRYAGSVVINAAGGRYYEPAPERTLSVGLTLRGDR